VVPHVRVLAILMIVNGALECLWGLLLGAMGPFMYVMMHQDQGMKEDPQGKVFIGVMSGVYLALGLLCLTAGVLNIIAGIRARKFRGRIFALVALFFNVVPMFTVYCAPTSIGVLIYGLLVFFNAEVVRAFALGDQGVPAAEIVSRFGGPRRRYSWGEEEEDD
jgi:hypothetical protein